ncbi:MAG: DUF4091 domain-containing protein [Bacteroidales bacterium]|nr:DUF4091 domain-containing protein [Bacteroidales bacterium]
MIRLSINKLITAACAVFFLLAALSVFVSCGTQSVGFFWSSTGTRMYVDTAPQAQDEAFRGSFWKGERAFGVAVVKTDRALSEVEVVAGNLRCGRNTIPASAISSRFELPVLGDSLIGKYDQCGARDSLTIPRIKVYDILDNSSEVDELVPPYRPVWITVNVPSDAVPGVYRGKLMLRAGGKKIASLPITIKVDSRTLPQPEEWRFHLDLWQNPYAVARYHSVEPWSQEHFNYMDPVMSILAKAGQKTITATITGRPWNGQTEDPFGSMVTKTLRVDGSWQYDYSVFDKWVEYMMGHGIDRQINCYSLITFTSSFDYYDEATSAIKTMEARPGTKQYQNFWEPFIHDFAAHLRQKGWFEKTCLAMDESRKDDLVAVRDFIRRAEPEFRLSLAGLYHPEVEPDLYYLSVTFHGEYPASVVSRRSEEGKVSTVYTCCDEKYPNTFIASPPAEAAWLPVYALSGGYDGYLRWAYNSWTADPMKDARYRLFAAGDCFLVYPEGRSSVRMEMLTEGIQQCEKIRILRESLSEEALDKLESVMGRFTYGELSQTGAQAANDELKDTISNIQ